MSDLVDLRWGMEKLPSNHLKMIDLFCGAGIGAVGFHMAGYEIVYAVDNKAYAIRNYNRNIPGNHAVLKDIKKLKANELPYADVYTGGFPCTPFSEGGSSRGVEDKELGDLGFHFHRLVEEGNPKAFIIENVGGLTRKKHLPFFNELIGRFESNYKVTWKVLNTWEYGVPQMRKRVFIVGIRKDLEREFIFPVPLPVHERKTLKDAIGDLPNPDDFSKEELDSLILNHKYYYDGGYSSRYISRNRQKQWDQPSFTIVSQPRQLPLHPSPPNFDIRYKDSYDIPPPRRLTVRECLRIQTVPDWFSFCEDTEPAKQHERCSGIPSLFAYKIGRSLSELLLSEHLAPHSFTSN